MPDPDDLTLLRQVATRDRKAFEALYGLYYRRLFAYLLKLTRRAERVEEILNDVMMAIWTGAARFDGRSRPSTWIFGIAYHKAMKALSRREPTWPRWEDASDPGDEVAEPRAEGMEPERLLARSELKSTLGKALGALSPEQRAVVELTYYYEMSYAEIAAVVGCPVNTVKTRMFHARRRLRELLPGLGVTSQAG